MPERRSAPIVQIYFKCDSGHINDAEIFVREHNEDGTFRDTRITNVTNITLRFNEKDGQVKATLEVLEVGVDTVATVDGVLIRQI